MPIPVPTPTAAQIVAVAEIAWVTTDQATAMIAADSNQDISNAKWAATLSDIAAWPGFVYGGKRRVKKVDTIEFFDNPASGSRLDFRNNLRRRYGLPDLSTDEGTATEICYSTPAASEECC